MIKIVIMMIWILMKMPDFSSQEEHLMHEGDRMATVMGFLSEVFEICCVLLLKCRTIRKFVYLELFHHFSFEEVLSIRNILPADT